MGKVSQQEKPVLYQCVMHPPFLEKNDDLVRDDNAPWWFYKTSKRLYKRREKTSPNRGLHNRDIHSFCQMNIQEKSPKILEFESSILGQLFARKLK